MQVTIVTPFNFPLEIPLLQLMGALYMGNKPLLKVDSKVLLFTMMCSFSFETTVYSFLGFLYISSHKKPTIVSNVTWTGEHCNGANDAIASLLWFTRWRCWLYKFRWEDYEQDTFRGLSSGIHKPIVKPLKGWGYFNVLLYVFGRRIQGWLSSPVALE